MTASSTPSYTLFEEIAAWLGYERLRDRYASLPPALIAWGIVVFVIDVVVLQAIKEFEGYQATFFVNPTWLIQPVLGLLAPFVVVYLHRRYRGVLEAIDVASRTTEPAAFDSLAPRALRVVLYAILGSYAIYQFIFNVGVNTITEIGGLSELIGVAVVIPLGYGVIFAEFLSTYIGILVVFPRKIRRTDFKVNFLDPEGLGGLRPAGELMKLAYYFVVVGLIGFAIMLYGPSIVNSIAGSPYEDPGIVQNVLFTLVWVLAIGTMAYGLSQIHVFMKRAKRRELIRLEKGAREHVDEPFDMGRFEIRNEEEFDELRRRMEYINNTQEYPTTFTMWMQISIGVVLPKAVQLVLSAV
jgi:hypothetical protein